MSRHGGKGQKFTSLLAWLGGVMVYDVTDPENAEFVNYMNSREFEAVIQGDVSPEDTCTRAQIVTFLYRYLAG